MGNDNKELDELYTDQNYQIGLSGLINDSDVAKFNLEYIKEKQNFKVVKQLLYVLAFFPSGMTLHDIDQLNDTQLEGFGHLQLMEFFDQFVMKDQKKIRMKFLNVYNDENGQMFKICLE